MMRRSPETSTASGREQAWDWPPPAARRDRGPSAVGADLHPETLLSAYRHGFYVFPPANDRWLRYLEEHYGDDLRSGRIAVLGDAPAGFETCWFDPDPRPVLRPHGVHIGRSLRRTLRHSGWTTTVDLAVERVLVRCGPARGKESWLTEELVAAYVELARLGHAHSFEVWDGAELIGGTFGILVGGVLSAETAFTDRTGGGKAAILDAVTRLADGGGILLDTQMTSEHTKALGAAPIPRTEYHALLATGQDGSVTMPDERRSIEDLLARYVAPDPGPASSGSPA
jgi:leucyl/phenylalanyl-tRNA---protein transferase